MNEDLIIRRNKKGRGVYAVHGFKRGQIVCACPVLVWPGNIAADRFIGRYLWSWSDPNGTTHMCEALCLGISALFNHSPKPNTGSQRLYARQRMIHKALRDIERGEEILIDYGPAADCFKVL